MSGRDDSEQLTLLGGARPPRPRRAIGRAAAERDQPARNDPIAVVAVDTGLAHLDRPFDYVVPRVLDESARPGVRVRVRFSGRDRDGFILERRASSEHVGRLRPLRRVVSEEPVLTPAVLATARSIADRYAGTLGDVLRLAVPPRHATAARTLPLEPPPPGEAPPPADGTDSALFAADGLADSPAWARYPAGPSFLGRLLAGEAPAASLLVVPSPEPDEQWPALLAQAAAAAHAADRGALLVVPDARDVARAETALVRVLGKGKHVRLTADQGPQARYTAFLKVLRGHVRVVVGTRAAAFAPVRELGLVAWWDDGDDSLSEPRAPYPHVREVLRIRAEHEGAALLSAGFARTCALTHWVATGVAKSIAATRPSVRRSVPRVQLAGEGGDLARDPAAQAARLTSLAFDVARDGLTRGPILVQVPRRGYLPGLSCGTCRRPARCPTCAGPLAIAGRSESVACGWCGAIVPRWVCGHCGSARLRAGVVGARRTAEELGRAFANVPVVTSGSGQVLDAVDARPRLVIATPGAEPVAEHGYAAALLLDAWALLERADLGAGEEALRRWLGAAALVRGAEAGGRVVLAGVPGHAVLPAVEALVRWDPAGFAERELAERESLHLPPAVRLAALTGPRAALLEVHETGRWPRGARFMGPLPVAEGRERLLVSVPDAHGPELAVEVAALHARSLAARDGEPIQVRMDPPDPSR